MSIIKTSMYVDPCDGAGKIKNPGSEFFLHLAAEMVNSVDERRDKDSVLFKRMAMIRCGTALNLNGIWELPQLSPELQKVLDKYCGKFKGECVHMKHELGGRETDTDDETSLIEPTTVKTSS